MRREIGRARNLEPGGAYHQFAYNGKSFTLVSGDSPAAIEADHEALKLSIPSVLVRESESHYRQPALVTVPGITSRPEPAGVSFADLGRYLAFEYEALCRATYEELTTSLPDGLPVLMHVPEWHHRSYYYYRNGPEEKLMGDRPSSYETFQMLDRCPRHWEPKSVSSNIAPNQPLEQLAGSRTSMIGSTASWWSASGPSRHRRCGTITCWRPPYSRPPVQCRSLRGVT